MARIAAARSWVQHVAATSNAMDLPPGIFKRDPAGIARGLKRSVMTSRRTKGTKFQSAMSMLNLYVNRAGRSLTARDRIRLEAAKGELRRVFHRPPRRVTATRKRRVAGRRTTRGGAHANAARRTRSGQR